VVLVVVVLVVVVVVVVVVIVVIVLGLVVVVVVLIIYFGGQMDLEWKEASERVEEGGESSEERQVSGTIGYGGRLWW